MESRSGFDRWGSLLGAALLCIGVAALAYTAGASHPFVQQALPATGQPVYVYYRPWGAGPFFPLFFLVFLFFAVRLAIGRRRWGGPRGYYGYDGRAVPPMFEEWHRRAHARDADTPPQSKA